MSLSANDKSKMMQAILARRAKQAEIDAAKAQQDQMMMKGIKLTAPAQPVSVASLAPRAQQDTSTIQWNEQQQAAIDFAKRGEEFCMIGAAGTGKTTTVRQIVQESIELICRRTGKTVDQLKHEIALVAFTRRAVRNIARAVESIGAKKFCMTAHAYLEYAPTKDTYFDENGRAKTSRLFRPQVTQLSPKEATQLIIVDEASMLSYAGLFRELREGAPNAIFIFVGDLNQLPPVFGDAVLGYKLATCPVVELTHVYRQALESPIIWFQHNYTLKGNLVSDGTLEKLTKEATDEKGVEFIPFKKDSDAEVMCAAVANYMMRQYQAGSYDPKLDAFLIPFNKSFGTLEINLNFADLLAQYENRTVFEIIAGYERKYLAVGDFVMHEKREFYIKAIRKNTTYFGDQPNEESVNLNRWGMYRGAGVTELERAQHMPQEFDLDQLLMNTSGDVEDSDNMTLKASHEVVLMDADSGVELVLSQAGAISKLEFGYCITIHKSQGSEWRKVWLILHKQHKSMLSRELLYTGMTRAREKLTVMYSAASRIGAKDSTINRCLKRAVLPGVGWQHKIEAFKGKITAGTTGGWTDDTDLEAMNYEEVTEED